MKLWCSGWELSPPPDLILSEFCVLLSSWWQRLCHASDGHSDNLDCRNGQPKYFLSFNSKFESSFRMCQHVGCCLQWASSCHKLTIIMKPSHHNLRSAQSIQRHEHFVFICEHSVMWSWGQSHKTSLVLCNVLKHRDGIDNCHFLWWALSCHTNSRYDGEQFVQVLSHVSCIVLSSV